MVKNKLPIQNGSLSIKLVEGGKYPKWKEAFIERLGEEAADKVLADTPYNQVLVVQDNSEDE